MDTRDVRVHKRKNETGTALRDKQRGKETIAWRERQELIKAEDRYKVRIRESFIAL